MINRITTAVNGRYEWNFTNYYTTGIEVTDSKYELKSPLRADCYGIEFLADTRGQDTTDKDSDNDMFLRLLPFLALIITYYALYK